MASKRIRVFVWVAALVAATVIILSATTAFVIFRTVTSTEAPVAVAAQAFTEIRKLYPDRPPLIEIVDMRTGNARINRAPNSPRKNVSTVYFMYWDTEDEEIVRGEVPTWVTNLRLSITGIGNWSFSDFHVTREDIERYSPGILVDFKSPDGTQMIAWTK